MLSAISLMESDFLSENCEGIIISNDEMIAYIFSAVKNRKVSVLNLVDLYERTIDTNKTRLFF